MTLVRIILFLNFSFFTAVLSTGCLDTSSSKSKSSASTSTTNPSTTPSPKDLGFAGVKSVKNLDASTIEISWDQVDSTRLAEVSGYRVYELSATGEMTPLIQLPNFFGSYYHSVTEGTYHIYMVRVIDKDGLADSNSITKSALAYKGITSVTNVGSTTATVNFPAGGFATGGVKIYAISRGETKTFTASSITATSYDLTGLRSGSSYTFSAKALIKNGTSGSEDEDSNSLTVSKQTTALTKTNYQGPLLVQAFGAASGAPSGTPNARQVRLTWLPFTSEATGQNYRVVRVKKDGEINTITTKDCSASVIDSCVVCSVTVDLNNASPRTCTDTNVGDPNVAGSAPVYDYVVVLASSTDWPEELLPSSDDTDTVKLKKYRITTHVPPDNMVLVHRDSANYEMCSLMGKTSDPFNHQRCSYSGLGALPSEISAASYPDYFDSGNNPRYYDFGYNLFVDRWEAGCNWTASDSGGKCGSSKGDGNCFGDGIPPSTIGIDGNVYYDSSVGKCYVKFSDDNWYETGVVDQTYVSKAYTINPKTTEKKPPLVFVNSYRSWDICQSQNDTNYGKKRLLRRREQVAAFAWPTLSGEPDKLTDAEVVNIEAGGDFSSTRYCNTNSHYGVSLQLGKFNDSGINYELSATQGTVGSFVIGSQATNKCISRFGLQDHVGNIAQWTSDQFSVDEPCNYNGDIGKCVGQISSLDNKNEDYGSISFDGSQGPRGSGGNNISSWVIGIPENGASYFSVPLGVPLVHKNSVASIINALNIVNSNPTSSDILASKFHGDRFYLYTGNDNDSSSYSASRGLTIGSSWDIGAAAIGTGGAAGRWTVDWGNKSSIESEKIGFRCALPAE